MAILTRIRRAGLPTVVIQDTPASASNVQSCVSEDLQRLESRAFPRIHDKDKEFDVRAARRAPEPI